MKLFFLIIFLSQTLFASEKCICVSVRPIYSLVASLVKGLDSQGIQTSLYCLLDSNDHHDATLKPSALRALSKSDFTIFLGFYDEDAKNLHAFKNVVFLKNIEGLKILKKRFFASHDVDPHFFLNIKNMKRISHYLCEKIKALYPKNASVLIDKNHQALQIRLDNLDVFMKKNLGKVQKIPYMMSHDFMNYIDDVYHTQGVDVLFKTEDHHASGISPKILKKLHVKKYPLFLDENMRIPFAFTVVDYMGSDLSLDEHTFFNTMQNFVQCFYASLVSAL
jgi:ABC-type Zn2+ transport system substrate-binding protein/surface adhesin